MNLSSFKARKTAPAPLFQKVLAHAASALVLAVLILAVPVTGFVAHGQTPPQFPNPIKATSIDQLLTSVLQVVIMLGAIAVVFFLIMAGFKYVTARGDEKAIASANAQLTWTVIGGMVVLGAQVISTAIQGTVNQLK